MGEGTAGPLERRQLEPKKGGVDMEGGSSRRQAASFSPPDTLCPRIVITS